MPSSSSAGVKANEGNIFLPVMDKIAPNEDFDERAYLERRPDVAAAIARGIIPSALFHYQVYGRSEAEPAQPVPDTVTVIVQDNSGNVDGNVAGHTAGPPPSACHIDTIICSKSGSVLWSAGPTNRPVKFSGCE